MLGSLRFRLTALFALGILVIGLVTIAIALGLVRDVTREQAVQELEREAQGLASLYAEAARATSDEGTRAPEFAADALELATGDRLFYVGASLFPGQRFGLERLPASALGGAELSAERLVTFEFVPPGDDRKHVAAAQPVRLEPGTEPFGWLVVAKPLAELREEWVRLLERLALALAIGVGLAGALFWWLSRRLTEPVLALTRAADEVARGRYDVEVPQARGSDEISVLSERFSEMVARLAEAERLKRRFLMSVSHELRTPLTAIRGHVEAIREGVVSDPEQVEASLDVVAAETDRLERLVGDVLDLAKLQAHQFAVRSEEVDMGAVVERAHASFTEESRRRDIKLELSLDDGAPVIVSDGDRVLQVITNLLANAFRWTPDGMQVGLRLSRWAGGVRVEVWDSGPGIPQDKRERIFEPFISDDAKGTGLGLPIASELAVALGGRIELESEPGVGSVFALVLPAALPVLDAPELDAERHPVLG